MGGLLGTNFLQVRRDARRDRKGVLREDIALEDIVMLARLASWLAEVTRKVA
jgi:hypothetical protein